MISKEILERLATKTMQLTNAKPEDLEFREMMMDSKGFFTRPVAIVGVYLSKMTKTMISIGHLIFAEVDGQGYIPLARPQFAEPDHYLECMCREDGEWRLHIIGYPVKGHLLSEYFEKAT